MERGVVKWYDEVKGYGFFQPDVGDKDLFVHQSNIDTLEKTLEKGERVEFEKANGKKGPEAHKVRPIAPT